MLPFIKKYVHSALSYPAKMLLPASPDTGLYPKESRLSEHLVIEEALEDEGRVVFVLSDEAIGTWWELDPTPHESYSESELEEKIQDLARALCMVKSDRTVLQVIFSQEQSAEFPHPRWAKEPRTFAQRVLARRIEAISSNASRKDAPIALTRRQVFVCLRVEYRRPVKNLGHELDLWASMQAETEVLKEALSHLNDIATSMEGAYLARFARSMARKGEAALVNFLRRSLHHPESQHGDYFKEADRAPGLATLPLRERVLNGSVSWSEQGVVPVGGGRWEVLSWSGQPAQVYVGMTSRLLQLPLTLRAVVSIRPKHEASDLESLANRLKGGDPYTERQKRDVFHTEDRIVAGETLCHVAWHLMVFDPSGSQSLGPKVVRELGDCIPLFCESHAALAVFVSTLPFHGSGRVAGFFSRERRVLSGDLGYLLPVLGGSRSLGSSSQLMQTRAGEALWLDPRGSRTNPHVAIYGASQSGKSFYLANLLISEIARDPETMIFLVDSLTSYEFLARAVGEDHGFSCLRPPSGFPNLFRGVMGSERIMQILGILEVAVGLVSKAELSAPEKTLLGDAILKTYEDNHMAARASYQPAMEKGELGHFGEGDGQVQLPRLTEIVHKLHLVAERHEISETIVATLREKLLPFFGTGSYGAIFDQMEYESLDANTPGFSLYDLAEISSSRELSTITTLIIIAEIERMIFDPRNIQRRGMLIIEEAGVTLGGENTHLERYVAEAFARFAKRGISCITVTNRIEHYTQLPACRAAWSTSATSVILPIMKDDERQRLKELVQNDYLAELARSLQKIPGQYSEFLWLSDNLQSTASYMPTGFDYWLAANHPLDVEALNLAKQWAGSWQKAIEALADLAPMGYRDNGGRLQNMNPEEIEALRRVLCGVH